MQIHALNTDEEINVNWEGVTVFRSGDILDPKDGVLYVMTFDMEVSLLDVVSGDTFYSSSGLIGVTRGKVLVEAGEGIAIDTNGAQVKLARWNPIPSQATIPYLSGNYEETLLYPDQPNMPSINLLSIPATSLDQPLHRHPEERIGLLISGTALLSDGAETHVVKSKSLVIISPQEDHAFLSPSNDCRYVVFHPVDAGRKGNFGNMMRGTLIADQPAIEQVGFHTKKHKT